jgi:hypothetical protein
VKELESQKTTILVDNLKDELAAKEKLRLLRPADEKLLLNILDLRAKINDAYAAEDAAMRRIETQRTGFIQEAIDARKKLFEDYFKWLDDENIRKDKEVADRLKQEVDEEIAGIKHWEQLNKQVEKEGMLIKTKESKYRGFFDMFKDLQEKTVEVLKDTNIKAAESDTRLTELKIDNQQLILESISGSLDAFTTIMGRQTEAGKMFAIAAATIDTYAAASKALNDPLIPSTFARIALMVSVIIRGLANVHQIMAVNTKGNKTSATSVPTSISSSVPAQRTMAAPAGSTIFTQPQLTQTQLNAFPNQNLLTAEAIAAALSKMPAPVVTVEDINAKIRSVNKVNVRANI